MEARSPDLPIEESKPYGNAPHGYRRMEDIIFSGMRIMAKINLKNSISKLITSSIFISFIAFLLAAFVVYRFTISKVDSPYNKEFIRDILVEAHGMLFDILIIGTFIFALQSLVEKKREKNRNIQRWEEEIDDYRYWPGEEAAHRIAGIVRRLNKQNVTSIDLSNCFLKGADLRSTNLEGASLWVANLEGAKLWVTNLKEADLEYANMQGANLKGANMQGALLYCANLKGALLVEANLEGAILNEVNLEGAILNEVNLEGADLRGVTDLTIEQPKFRH